VVAVDHEFRAGDPAGVVGGEVGDAPGDVVRGAAAVQGVREAVDRAWVLSARELLSDVLAPLVAVEDSDRRPLLDNLGAMASPRPFAPPVTTATLPLNRDMLCSWRRS
jgi:hypothetical protein